MKIKTSELSGAALDWAVAKSTGNPWLHFSSDWSQGGPLFESWSRMTLCETDGECSVAVGMSECSGNTILEAFCRALVTERSGPEVEVPDELVKVNENEQ